MHWLYNNIIYNPTNSASAWRLLHSNELVLQSFKGFSGDAVTEVVYNLSGPPPEMLPHFGATFHATISQLAPSSWNPNTPRWQLQYTQHTWIMQTANSINSVQRRRTLEIMNVYISNASDGSSFFCIGADKLQLKAFRQCGSNTAVTRGDRDAIYIVSCRRFVRDTV